MIQKFVEAWDARKGEIEAQFRAKHPDDYAEIVKAVVTILVTDHDRYASDQPDPKRITSIDHGDYQGTLLFIIASTGYQPSDFWFVKVSYGSCSGCDTLQSISGYSSEPPTDEQVADYMILALHILQGIAPLIGDEV